MTNEEIKNKKEAFETIISLAQEGLKGLREVCKHEKTFKGNYSYRVGVIEERDICEYCGEVIN